MQNQQILKKALPFLAVFVLSLFVAGSEYIKQISAPTNAADEDISIQLVNTAAPTDPDSEWRWNAAVYIDNYFQQPIQGTYTVDWCNATFAEQTTPESCKPTSHPEDYNSTIAEGTFTIDSRQTTIGITHPSVDCGRVQVNFVRDDETLVSELLDTGIMCDTPGLVGLSAFENGGDELDIVKEFAFDIISIVDETEAIQNDSPSNPDPGPGGEQPEPLPSVNPTNIPQQDNESNVYSSTQLFTYVVDQENGCNSRLDINNISCLFKNTYGFNNEQIAKESLRDDTQAVYDSYGLSGTQCVAGSRAMLLADTGYEIPGVRGGARTMIDESYWGGTKLEQILNDGTNRPQPGDLAIWDYGFYTDKNGNQQRSSGHVAYVVSVTGTRFKTFDVNKDFAGGFSIENSEISNSNLKGWLRYNK